MTNVNTVNTGPEGTSEYITTRVAAEMLGGVTTQYIYKLCKDELLDSQRPQPRHVIITRASVVAWANGERPKVESLNAAKRYILEHSEHASIDAMPVQEVDDLLYGFISDIRPDWHRSERGRWVVENMTAILAGR